MAFTLANQVLVLFILLACGYFLIKMGFVSEQFAKELTSFTCFIVAPCMAFSAFELKFSPQLMRGLLITVLSALGVHLAGIAVADIIFNKRVAKDASRRSIMRFATVYSNCGFMGLPLLQTVVGPKGIFYGAAYIAVFNLLNWTHGMMLYTGKTDARSVKTALVNPNVIAVFAGIILFCFSIKLPAPLHDSLKYISSLNTALSMIVIGTQIAKVNLRQIFSGAQMWLGTLLRNICIPFALMFALHFLGVRGPLLLGCILPAACPVAGNTVLFAELVGNDTAFPVRLMTLSTLLCIVTIPLIVAVDAYLNF